MKLAVLVPSVGARANGVRDHARLLADAMARFAEILPVEERALARRAFPLAARLAAEGCTAALLPYTPNLYGWRNPFPVLFLGALRRRGLRTLTLFHEIFMPRYAGPWRNLIQRPYNYVKDRAVFALTDCPMVTFSRRADELARARGARPAVIPVFSNLPEAAGGGVAVTHLLGTFGTLHPDTDAGTLAAALRRMPAARMLFVGDMAPLPALTPQADFTGPLAPGAAATALTRMKYFVLCDRRGISFRKGSAAAALLNRVPVIATRTEWTDVEFQHRENVYFFDGTDTGLCNAVQTLESDPALARRIAENGRRLYDSRLAVELAARAVLQLAGE